MAGVEKVAGKALSDLLIIGLVLIAALWLLSKFSSAASGVSGIGDSLGSAWDAVGRAFNGGGGGASNQSGGPSLWWSQLTDRFKDFGGADGSRAPDDGVVPFPSFDDAVAQNPDLPAQVQQGLTQWDNQNQADAQYYGPGPTGSQLLDQAWGMKLF